MGLEEHFEEVRQKAINLFLEYGFLTPVLFLLKADKIVAMVPMLFESHQKEASHRQILEKAKTLGVDGFIEAAESWYVKYEDGEPPMAPSKHPKRQECITMFGRQRRKSGIETEVRIYGIVRRGKSVDLVRESDAEPEHPETATAWFDRYLSEVN